MSMGNYLCVAALPVVVMAASTQPVGLDHPTVVPENFEREDADSDADDTAFAE
jgi:hypothetical protein